MKYFYQLQDSIEEAVQKVFPEKNVIGLLEVPKQDDFGDFSSPVAMKLAKMTGESPMKIAETIVAVLEVPAFFEKPTIAAPGFINFSFQKEFLENFISEILKDQQVSRPNIGKGQTVVTDISHPNVAKPMGVHHLLSTVIGDAINRMLAYAGYKVVRDDYLGDWGTQFGKLIHAYKQWGDKEKIAKNPIPALLELYVKFHDEAEKNPTLEEEGRKEFKKLEDGDPENKKLWQWAVDVSLKEFYKTWNTLDVKFDVIHGESFYEDRLEDIIEMGKKKGAFVTGEKGALICEFHEEGYPPAVVRKSDGATLYATRDLARIQYWEETWHPAMMVNVVDMAQKMYFQQLFAMARKLNLTQAPNIHVAFGRMKFPDRRMSTRKGNIVLLEEVMDEAIALARKIVEEKNPELSDAKKEEVSRIVGIGALKFAVLVQNRETDTTFTWEKMLSLEGESAPYVQYAHARAQSILRKAQETGINMLKVHENFIKSTEAQGEKEERDVARTLPKFPFVITLAIRDFRPNILARYLSDLVAKFSVFYNACPVLQAENEKIRNFRLRLVTAIAIILKTGLNLLGIQAPDEM